MITREKLINSKSTAWHMILLAVVFILVLAGIAMGFYWYMFGGKTKLSIEKKELPRGVYVYPRYKLENVLKQKIFGTGIDVSR